MSYKHFMIKAVSVKSFFGACSISLDRLDQFVILVGPNGCGKTSFLKALGRVFGNIPDKSLPKGAVVSGNFDRDGSADGTARPIEEPFDYKGPTTSAKKDDVVGRYISPNRERLQSPPRDTEQKKRQLQELDPFKDQGARHLLSELAVCANECRDDANPEIKSKALAKWKQYCSVVKTLLGKNLTYESDSLCDDTFSLQLRLDGVHWTEAYLSDGEVNLLQILFRALIGGDDTKPPDVLFLDEPELHLHPDNQRKLIEKLKELVGKKTQVFIATHSPYILSCFDLSHIRYISLLNSNGEQPVFSGVKVYSSGLIDLMGGETAVINQMVLFNYAEWGALYHFLSECITDPTEVARSQPGDPQCEMVMRILPNKEKISLLDYGCGEGRLVSFFQDEKPELAKKIDYTGYHLRSEKIKSLDARYKDHPFQSCKFLSVLPAGAAFDRIVSCNVVHEIESLSALAEACQTWKNILTEDGHLVIIEDSELRVGEIKFLIFDEEELQVLFGRGQGRRSTTNDRIFCVAWEKNSLKVPDDSSCREALNMVKNRAHKQLNEIEAERPRLSGEDLSRASRRYGFYLALYANAARRLSN